MMEEVLLLVGLSRNRSKVTANIGGWLPTKSAMMAAWLVVML
jgi:hypothetical protein